MPRRRRPEPREIPPDPVYNSVLVHKFINCIMWDGKKTVAQRLVYQAFDKIRERTGQDPLKIFVQAVENCKPIMEVKTRRVGGANYQVPVEVPERRQVSLALRWLRDAARARSEKGMAERLANEFLDAYNNRGGAIKKKEDVHRMAEANKAFAHYRW